jgi:hypothetical protein
MKRIIIIVTWVFFLHDVTSAQSPEWGFRTSAGDYLALTRADDGSLSGSLFDLNGDATIKSHAITGFNTEKGKMTLKIPDLYGEEELSLSRGLENGNVTWRLEAKPNNDVVLELRGITNRTDPLADQMLLDWKGNTGQLIDIGTYTALTAYIEKKYGKSVPDGQSISIIAPNVHAAFWDAYSFKENVDASVRTYFDDKNLGTALVATTPKVVMQAYAYTDHADASSESILGEIKSKASVIGGPLSRFSVMKVPTRSVFDDYYEDKPIENIQSAIAKMLKPVSSNNDCGILKTSNKIGEIQCVYHNSEYNFSGNYTMKTVVAFFIEDATPNGKRVLVWQPISFFAKDVDIDEMPLEDEFNRIEEKDPYIKVENAMLGRFFNALSKTYAGSEVTRWR